MNSKRRVIHKTILAQTHLYLLEKTPFRVIIANVWENCEPAEGFAYSPIVQRSKWQRRKTEKEKNGSKSEPISGMFPEKDPMCRNVKLPINLKKDGSWISTETQLRPN